MNEHDSILDFVEAELERLQSDVKPHCMSGAEFNDFLKRDASINDESFFVSYSGFLTTLTTEDNVKRQEAHVVSVWYMGWQGRDIQALFTTIKNDMVKQFTITDEEEPIDVYVISGLYELPVNGLDAYKLTLHFKGKSI